MSCAVPVECGAGMVFKECGNTCMPTCADPDGDQCADDTCDEGCFCEDGKVYDGEGKCFEPKQCGCAVPDSDDRINVSGCKPLNTSIMVM